MTQTLHVTIESDKEFHARVLDDIEAFEQNKLDESESVPRYQLSLPNEQALSRVFSAKNIELIRAIAAFEPESMRETARIVDRGIKEVSRNLNELERLGLVEFEQDGRSKRPHVWYDEIDVAIEMPIDQTNESAHHVIG